MRYICTSLGCKREFEKASHRNQHEKDAHKSEPAQVSQEPIAVMWQHEETGNTGFVDMSQVENRFFKHNPRLKQVCFCYSSSPDYEALKAEIDYLTAMTLKDIAENEALKLRVADTQAMAEMQAKSITEHCHRRETMRAGLFTAETDRDNARLERDRLKVQLSDLEAHLKTVSTLTTERNELKERLGNLADWKALVAENEALKLSMDKLEAESRTKHEYAMQMLGERDALKVDMENPISKNL